MCQSDLEMPAPGLSSARELVTAVKEGCLSMEALDLLCHQVLDAVKFVQFLLREKYLFRSPSGQLLPYNKDSNAGLFIVRDFVTYCYTGSQTYFTPKGKEVIRMKFQKKCGEELLSKMAR